MTRSRSGVTLRPPEAVMWKGRCSVAGLNNNTVYAHTRPLYIHDVIIV